MSFDDFFSRNIEYGDPTDGFPAQGLQLLYISSTFLDGWINYVKPVRAFVLSRYSEDFSSAKAELGRWKASPPPHTKLGDLGDDVAILAKDGSGRYWYFYFDCDVSDCSIGVLERDALDPVPSEEQVVALFDAHVRGLALSYMRSYRGTGEAVGIGTDLLRGWLSFARSPAPRSDSAPTAGSPLAAVFGKWPGDETDEEIAAALRSETATHDEAKQMARWIIAHATSRLPYPVDHACGRCVPDGEIVVPGFSCALHLAQDIVGTSPTGSPDR